MKSSSPTKPIYGDIIAAAASPRPAKPEEYDRLTRKDFWNDPERWDGIDDPRETMIWEVRRPHVIDVRASPVSSALIDLEHAKMKAEMQMAGLQQSMIQSRTRLNQYGQQPGHFDMFGNMLGRH